MLPAVLSGGAGASASHSQMLLAEHVLAVVFQPARLPAPGLRQGMTPGLWSESEVLPALGLTCQNHWICLLFLV